MSRFRGYGVLPTFDLSDPIMAGLASKVSQAQATSAAAVPYLSDPVVQGAVAGLEQQLGTAYADLQGRIQTYKNATANPPSGDVTGGGTRPTMQHYFNAGNIYQQQLFDWRATPAGAHARPDRADYEYPGGEGQLMAAITRWQALIQSEAVTAGDALRVLLDQYNSKVPAAYKADADLAQAKANAQIAAQQQANAQTETQVITAQKEVVKAHVDLVQTTATANKAIAAINNPPMNPLILAALVGVPLLGIGAYFLTKRKKSSSVAGYRRRARSGGRR